MLSDGALLPEAAAKGISYTKTDDNSGKLSLGGTFFSTFAGGIHEVEFTMTDVAQAEGTGKARIATPDSPTWRCTTSGSIRPIFR